MKKNLRCTRQPKYVTIEPPYSVFIIIKICCFKNNLIKQHLIEIISPLYIETAVNIAI